MGASQITASASGFQCSFVGGPVTSGRLMCSTTSSSESSSDPSLFLPSPVDRRLSVCAMPSRLSKLPRTLRGGVRV